MKMKSVYVNLSSLFLLLLSITIFSCASVNRFHQDTAMAREKDKKSFVQTTDGNIIEASDAVLRTPLFGKASVQLNKDTKIPVKDVMAYQNSNAYFRRVDGQFIPRIKKGPINMYMSTVTYQEYGAPTGPGGMGSGWRTRTQVVYHVQKGDDAEVVKFSPALIGQYVHDYAPAMEFVHLYEHNQRKYKTWSLINTAATLGGLALAVTAGVDQKNNLKQAGYAGTGLFFGGIINGFVTKIRKGKNIQNLELAIDEYNRQGTKAKRD